MNWEVAGSFRCQLGEGPVWDVASQSILWVDITAGNIHQFCPDSGSHSSYFTGQQTGSIVLEGAGQLVAALQNGFFRINLRDKTQVPIADPERHLPGNRFNDGKCDPAGRFWAGTTSVQDEPGAGKLYCLDRDLSVSVKIPRVGCSNGLAWSPDHQTLYFIDSLAQNVVAYDYDVVTGAICHFRTILEIPPQNGIPDGMTVDTEGMLWVALWGGGKVIRIDPATGTILHEISLPVTLVTSCTFGGKDLRDLYITSADIGLTGNELQQQPLAGSLFVCRNTSFQGYLPHLFVG